MTVKLEGLTPNCIVVPADKALKIHAGQRHTVLKLKDLEHYRGERGRRGLKLPQGFRKVDRLEPV